MSELIEGRINGNTIELKRAPAFQDGQEVEVIISAPPVETQKHVESGRRPVFGSARGQFWMSEDFDKPLDLVPAGNAPEAGASTIPEHLTSGEHAIILLVRALNLDASAAIRGLVAAIDIPSASGDSPEAEIKRRLDKWGHFDLARIVALGGEAPDR